MNQKDRDEVLKIINERIEQDLWRIPQSFFCPECKGYTLAMMFVPKSNYPLMADNQGRTSYSFIQMNIFNMTGRQCLICKKKFVLAPPHPVTSDYIEEK